MGNDDNSFDCKSIVCIEVIEAMEPGTNRILFCDKLMEASDGNCRSESAGNASRSSDERSSEDMICMLQCDDAKRPSAK